ncbi:hypothetical protein V8C34DRAFT_267668 [Trichoderma compactum]
MTKRQSDDSALLPRKKAKLHAVHDDDNPNTHALHSPPPPPLTLAGFERREKRKRSLDSQPDTSEEPKTKQARRSQSPEESSDTDSVHFELHESESLEEPPSTSSQPDTSEEPKTKQDRRSQSPEESSDTNSPWPCVESDEDDDKVTKKAKQARRSQSPEESSDTDSVHFELHEIDDDDKPTEEHPWQEFCRQSTREAKEYLSTVRICRCRNHQTRLLSPGLSDEDTTDEDVADEDTTDESVADTTDESVADEGATGSDEGATGSNQLGFPTIHPSARGYIDYPRPIAQKQPHTSRPLRKRDTTTPQRKRRQPLKKDKEESKQNKSRGKAIEAFLSSKRSSRRNRDCTLWRLGDDGMAYTVSIAR